MNYLKSFLQFEAIGFKISGDNRDEDSDQPYTSFEKRKRIGFKQSEEFNDKVKSIISKLKDMATMGNEEGEREAAKNKLMEISKKYNINIDNINSDKNPKLGFRFSWEEVEKEINDLDKEIKMINQ